MSLIKIRYKLTQTNHECDNCDYKCEKDITMKKHRHTENLRQSFNERKHIVTRKKNSSQLNCDECDQVCFTKKNLKKHKAQLHTSTLKCDTCGNPFNTKDDLEIHI